MNLLQSKAGRLTAFGGLYLSEGIPAGFLMLAIATEIQRRGMSTAAYGTFVAVLAFPWIWKFVMGPFVDNLYIKRFGARKQWIVTAQIGMLAALIAAMFFMPDTINVQMEEGKKGVFATMSALYASGIGLFATLLLIHNSLAATQDVAIDALACQILKPEERGLANGVMFGSTQAGYTIGGSGVLWLNESLGSFELASVAPMVLMGTILTGVIFLIVEKSAAQEIADGELPAPEPGVSGFAVFRTEISDYLRTVGKAIFRSRNGFLTFLLALTPIGGLALSMLLSALIAPRIGMTDGEIATLNLATTLVFVPFCLLGGWLSDRFDRRIMFAISASMTILPGLWMAHQFKQAGWNHPPDAVDGVWAVEQALITAWWMATLTFTVFSGFTYGVKNAFYMDMVTPKIAATQFTALMAFTNLTNIYSKIWQSQALEVAEKGGWHWPVWKLLYVDSAIGLVFLVWLFLVKPKQAANQSPTIA